MRCPDCTHKQDIDRTPDGVEKSIYCKSKLHIICAEMTQGCPCGCHTSPMYAKYQEER